MSAEKLREAAALMRERAEAATRGPWRADGTTVGGARHQPVVMGGFDSSGSLQDPCAPWDAEHIASWHPAVALAVADWLDEAADHLDVYEDDDLHPALRPHVCPTALEGTECSVLEQALVVARAYLGEA